MRLRRGKQVNGIFQADHIGFKDNNAMLVYPIQYLLEVSALMKNIEVGKRIFDSLRPVVSEHRHVATTHNILPEHFDAVV
jgi:hypothetical protein